ncbi:MAG: carbon-nitrogen hydrolase family protein [Deltaproteobacteria bacterium]|nr:carbon-nitrogen hydrolase family protein [Deltaproteobacteria bacterium]MBW2253599.1 carbon-nitrogen hydrolase family protein [Deltaproteobacteria bacterium]
MFLAAVVQLTCTSNQDDNWEMTRCLVERAAEHGARLVATPENTNFLGHHDEKVRLAEPLDGPTVSRLRELAAGLGIHVLLGSFNERSDDPRRCYNTSVLIGPDGQLLGTYRKIHLFDVDLPPELCFAESATVEPGDTPVVVDCALGRLGLSICYDLRFPELYQLLVSQGANILTVPSAFTLTTGKDHWEPLLRARAIENQCYVLAPAQYGKHDDNGLRHSWGHAMIIDPWGSVVAQCSDGPGIAMAEIDLSRVAEVRRSLPVADHRRL